MKIMIYLHAIQIMIHLRDVNNYVINAQVVPCFVIYMGWLCDYCLVIDLLNDST